MAYAQALRDYAKMLYLTLDDQGNQIESLYSIAKKVSEKLKEGTSDGNALVKPIPRKTVTQWVHEGFWKEDLERKREGLPEIAKNSVRNKEAFDALHEVIERKILYTRIYHGIESNEEYCFSDHEIETRRLTPQQELIVYKILSDRQTHFESLEAEKTRFKNNTLDVNIRVIQKGQSKKR